MSAEAKLWRCANPECEVGGDFESDVPVCPSCKADQRVHEALIIPLACIHYLAIDKEGPIRTPNGNRVIACMRLRQRLPKHATSERSEVNCPKCRASEIYKAHDAAGVEQHVPIVERKLSMELGKEITQSPGG